MVFFDALWIFWQITRRKDLLGGGIFESGNVLSSLLKPQFSGFFHIDKWKWFCLEHCAWNIHKFWSIKRLTKSKKLQMSTCTLGLLLYVVQLVTEREAGFELLNMVQPGGILAQTRWKISKTRPNFCSVLVNLQTKRTTAVRPSPGNCVCFYTRPAHTVRPHRFLQSQLFTVMCPVVISIFSPMRCR